VPAASLHLTYDESFVSRLNRALEWRTRAAFGASLVAVPRWGLSVSGIGVVGAVLGCFGAQSLLMRSGLALPVMLGLGVLLSWALTWRWRAALGVLFALVVTTLIGFWGWSQLRSSGLLDAISLIESLAIGFALIVAVVARERADSASLGPSVTRLLAIEESSAAVVLAALAAIIVALFASGGRELASIVGVGAAMAALLISPAAATALEAVFPRRKTVTELYGNHA
jgi:hypothetical protein